MANKKKPIIQEREYHCRDCEHSFDYHEKNYMGEPFMCRCPFHKWSRFLDKDFCPEHFKKRHDVQG